MKTVWTAAALAIALAITINVGDASAQAAKSGLILRKIDGKKVQTPEYQLQRNQYVGRSRDWFRIETTYDTEPEWVDEVAFTYYVLVQNRDTKGPKYLAFRGDVTYANVQKGRHKSDMFIHPSTLARYGDVQSVAVMVNVAGRLAAMETQPPTTQRWWEQVAPQDGYLLNRMQTPFAMINFDDFEAVKPVAGR